MSKTVTVVRRRVTDPHPGAEKTTTTSTEDSVSTTRFVTSADRTRIADEVSGTGTH